MKKTILVLIALLSFSGAAYAEPGWQVTATLTVGGDNVTGDSAQLPQHIGGVAYVYIPTLTSSTVTVKGSLDNSVFGTVGGYDNNATMVDWTVPAGTGGKTYRLPDLRPFRYIQFIFGSAQAASRSLVVFGTGKGDN